MLRPAGLTRIWLPTPLTIETRYQKPLGNTLTAEGGTTSTRTIPESADAIACFEFPEGVKPVAVLTCRARTLDYTVDLADPQPRGVAEHTGAEEEIRRFLQPTKMVPTERHRQGHRDEDHCRKTRGHRQGARDLRVGRREHLS